MFHRRAPLVVSLALTLHACGGSTPAPASTPAPRPATAPRRPAAPAPLPDANTAAILSMSNNVDLAYARIAALRASNRDVKTMARRETTAHTTLNTSLTSVLRQLDLSPRDDEISRAMRDQSYSRRDSLRALSGRRFDSAYVANEIRYHRELLIAIDRVFVPSVQRDGLREYVLTMRPELEIHLERAERIRDALASARK